MLLSIILFFLVLPPVLATCPSGVTDPLQCYLYGLVFSVPDQCTEVSGTQLCTSNVVVEHLTLSDLPSSFLAAYELQVGVSGAGAQISGSYKYGFLKGSLTGSVLTSFGTDVLVETTTTYTTFPMPAALAFSDCAFSQMNVKIDFGSAILNAAASILEKQIAEAVEKEICTTLPTQLATNSATKFSTEIDPRLVSLISTGPGIVPDYSDAAYVNWGTSILGKLYSWLSVFEKSRVYKCLQEKHPKFVLPLLPTIVNDIVDHATNGTGIATFAPRRNHSFILGNASRSTTSLSVTLLSVTLSGLDTITQLTLLEPVASSNVSLSSDFGIDSLGVLLELELRGGSSSSSGSPNYRETLLAKTRLRNVVLSTETVVAVERAALDALYIDQLLSQPNGTACWLSAVKALNVTSLVANVDVSQLVVEEIKGSAGALEHDIVVLVNNTLSLIVGGFEELITATLAGVAQGPIRASINKALEVFVVAKASSSAAANCPAHTTNPTSESSYVSWPESKALAAMDELINEGVGAGGVNNLMQCLTDGSGQFTVPLAHGIGVSVGNLDSFYDLSLLVPRMDNPFALSSRIGVGSCSGSDGGGDNCTPLTVSVSLSRAAQLLVSADDADALSLSLSNVHVGLEMQAKVNSNTLGALTWGQLGTKGCLASAVELLQLEDVNATLTAATLTSGGGGQAKTMDTTRAIQALLTKMTSDSTLKSMNENIASTLGKSQQVCANGGSVPNDSGSATSGNDSKSGASLGWILGAVGGSLGLALCLFILRRYRYKSRGEQGAINNDYKPLFPEPATSAQSEGEDGLALCRNPQLSLYIRGGIPILLLLNTALFIWSNTAPDAVTVMARVRIGSATTIGPVQVFSFSFAGTVNQMWEAKVYFLALVICFFTGAWPYIKLLVMAASWFLPSKLLSVGTRYAILRFVDAYGKYSLVDFYVMVLMICAFYFDMPLTAPSAQGEGIEVFLFTEPHLGFNIFLLSTILSLVLGHVVVAAHRHVFDSAHHNENQFSAEAQAQAQKKTSLAQHSFALSAATAQRLGLQLSEIRPQHKDDSQSGYGMRLSRVGAVCLFFFFVATLLLCMAGTMFETFQFAFQGLTGLLLQDAATTRYSYVSVGMVMPIASNHPHETVVVAMQVCYFLFGVVVPYTLCFVLGLVWLLPLTLKVQKRLLMATEVLNAWACIDVFCLAVFAAILQIQQFAKFIVGDSCDGLDVYLQKYLDPALHGNDVCFDVVTTLLPQSWALFTAAVTLFLWAHPTLLLLDTCVQERCSIKADAASHTASADGGASLTAHQHKQQHRNAEEEGLTRPLLLEDISLHNPTTPQSGLSSPSSSRSVHTSPDSPSSASSYSGLTSSRILLSSILTQGEEEEDDNDESRTAGKRRTFLQITLWLLWRLSLVDVCEGSIIVSRRAVMERLRAVSRQSAHDVSVT